MRLTPTSLSACSALGLLLGLASLLSAVQGASYVDYLDGIEKRNRALHDDYLARLGEDQAGFLDRLDGHVSDVQARHYVSDSAYPSNFDADRYWAELLERTQDNNDDDLDEADSAAVRRSGNGNRGGGSDNVGVYDAAARLLTAAASRREEEPFLNRIWGAQKVSGGAGEPGQVTGPTNRPQQGKVISDTLPSYCNPPNPCPVGVDPSKLTAPCDAGVRDSARFNRDDVMRKMADGQCPCDNEHMECPAGTAGVAAKKSGGHANPYLKGNKRDKLDSKKSPRFSVGKRGVRAKFHAQVMEKKNPWLDGVDALDTVEKKAGQRLHFAEEPLLAE